MMVPVVKLGSLMKVFGGEAVVLTQVATVEHMLGHGADDAVADPR